MSLMRVGKTGARSASPEFEGQFFIHARSGYLSGLIGPSSNGRTADFGSVNGGSNPPGPTAPVTWRDDRPRLLLRRPSANRTDWPGGTPAHAAGAALPEWWPAPGRLQCPPHRMGPPA